MYKKLFLLTPLIALLLSASSFADPVGIFDNAQDIGGPTGIGSTLDEGPVLIGDVLTEQYLITGGGADIWGNSDQLQFAYKTVSGDVRISANFAWVARSNTWAKYGVMLRESTDANSVHYTMLDRKDQTYAAMQGRAVTGGSSSAFGTEYNTPGPAQALGIQRVTVGGLTYIEGLADFGDGQGWQSRAIHLVFGLPDQLLGGLAVTSHDNNQLVQARAWNVAYEQNPTLVGQLNLPQVPASAAVAAPSPNDVSGFTIHTLKPLVTDGWGFDAARTIFDTGLYKGLPAMPGSEGTRVDQFVNLFDNGNRGAFTEDNGYPDASYPGIDPLETPAQDPAGGDVDENFGTNVTAVIQLTAGTHIIGANSDDGTIIEIGGVEVGRTAESKGASNVDFVYQVEADGYYPLRAINIQGGGGAEFELHEVLLDGTRILLNDVADGGSAVFAPAP
jgi:hypothetical protein